MKKLKKIAQSTAIILSASLLLSACNSEQTTKPNLEKSEQLIAKASNNQVKVIKHFDAKNNLTGFVVKNDSGQESIVYTANDGSFLFSGILFNANGENQSHTDFEQYVQPKSAVNAFQAAAKTSYIQQGKDSAPHKAYVLADPNCYFCHKTYEALLPEIQSGNLAVRWILVGVIKPDSPAKAMAILGSKDPVKAMEINENAFSESQEEGGIKPLENPSDATKEALNTNMGFMMNNKFNVTPIIIYKTQSGLIKLDQGMPQGDIKTVVDTFSNSWN